MVRAAACVWSLCWAVVLAGAMSVHARQFEHPETMWVNVIFYDFHPDGEGFINPDFDTYEGKPNAPYVQTGMVQSTLSPEKKPVPTGTQINISSKSTNLSKWFRPSGAGETNVFSYNAGNRRYEWTGLNNYLNRPGEFVGPYYDPSASMANVVIYDSLPFTYVQGTEGTYTYDNQSFFRLDGKGYGAEPKNSRWYGFTNPDNHNYSFTMELHGEFTYKPGLVFDIMGDDDVWVFIDNRLVIDLGGVHGPEAGRVALDTIGLIEGNRYHFAFFYAERLVTGSTIKITTNILTPGRLKLEFINPDTLLVAGLERDMIRAVLTDESGVPIAITPSNFRWWIVDPETGDRLSNPGADIARLYGEKAHRPILVAAEYTDTETGAILTATRRVHVVPAAPDKVVIEDIGGDTASIDRWVANPLDTLFMTIAQTEGYLYAVLRDRFNNYAGVASAAAWGSLEPTKVSVAPQAGAGWTGVVVRGLFVSESRVVVQLQAASPGVATPGIAMVVISNQVQVLPPVATPPGGTGGLHHFEDQVAVTLSAPTAGSSIRYCLNCAGTNPDWINYVAGSTITIDMRDTTTLRAYAYVDQQGYLDSEQRTWQYYRVPPGSLPPVAVPGDSTYRGSIEVVLQPNPASDGPVTIYYFIDRAGQGQPAGYGTANGWILYNNHTFTFNERSAVKLYAYSVNDEDINSVVDSWTYTNLDWQGPVITEALYFLGNPPIAGAPTFNPDTLVLTFDEPVVFTSLTAADLASLFAFADFDNQLSGAQVFSGARILEGGLETTTKITIILGNPDLVTPLQDSLGVVVGTLKDVWGNTTIENDKVIIKWGRDYDIIVGVAPNPADFSDPGQKAMIERLRSQIRPQDLERVPDIFTLVKVQSVDVIVVNDGDDPSGSAKGSETYMVVYDALGNVVKKNVRAVRHASKPNDIFFAWDLRNNADRLVGSGSYLGVINVKILGGGTKVNKVKLAVRH